MNRKLSSEKHAEEEEKKNVFDFAFANWAIANDKKDVSQVTQQRATK